MKSEFIKPFRNCPFAYIAPDNYDIEYQKNFKRLLEILEVDVDKLQPITQPTQFDKIILPDESFYISNVRKFTSEYCEMIERVRNFALKNRTPVSNKKVYYFHGIRQFGEERLAEYFNSKGYEIISPEKLTLDEQLNWMINCESFASTIGSCSHNSIFLREGTEAIFILRGGYFGTEYQNALNLVNMINAYYIDSTMSLFHMGNRNYCYIISEQLKRFFGDKWNGYAEDDFKAFLQYVKNSMAIGLKVHSTVMDYYKETFTDFMTQLKQREDLITACSMPKHWETFQPTLSYQTHVSNKGWIAWQNEEQISGSVENNFDIQAVKIKFPNHKVYYSVYYNAEEGWSEEVSNGEQAGTTGKFKAIYGIRIQLDEVGQKAFDVLYRVHKFDGEWTPWAKNGEVIYSYGQKLNALQVKLEPKN